MKPEKSPALENQQQMESALHDIKPRKGRPPKKRLSNNPEAVRARERRAEDGVVEPKVVRALREENASLKEQVAILTKVLGKAYEI